MDDRALRQEVKLSRNWHHGTDRTRLVVGQWDFPTACTTERTPRQKEHVRLPGGERARVEPEKLTDYLLSKTHPTGRFKARFFQAVGLDDIQRLKVELEKVARTGAVISRVHADHGVKYVVDGELKTPRGNRVSIRTVWIIESRSEVPRLVTAYPG